MGKSITDKESDEHSSVKHGTAPLKSALQYHTLTVKPGEEDAPGIKIAKIKPDKWGVVKHGVSGVESYHISTIKSGEGEHKLEHSSEKDYPCQD